MRLHYTTSGFLASVDGLRDIPSLMASRKVPHTQPTAESTASKNPGGTLRLRVRPTAESILRAGHPWLFADSIRQQTRPGTTGELAVVYDRNDRFLALGLFDASSAIRLRVLHRGKPRAINSGFWTELLGAALQRREKLFDDRTTGFRCINGESDGWPGFVLDRYASTLVLKLYTAAWLPWMEELTPIFKTRLQPERLVLRLSRNIEDIAKGEFQRRNADILLGPAPIGPVTFQETGLMFEADVLKGQKTGFFLDQRENRRRVETLSRGRSVLNAFSFSGGFSLYAARGGALSVTDLDISAHALAAGTRNFILNQANPAVRACRREQVQADAFEWLGRASDRKFDLVVLDPPSLARRETERAGAINAYSRLAALGSSHLNPGGLLVACSCSAHVSEEEFFAAILSGTRKSETKLTEFARAGQPADHPADFPEARYLKAIYLKEA